MVALSAEGTRVLAKPGLSGTCPVCREAVIAKCGEHIMWHWAHRAGSTCEASWSREPETWWHRYWKAQFPVRWLEQSIADHRADVGAPDGRVWEFQHSHLPSDAIRQRETAYGLGMTWVFDARDAYRGGRLRVFPRPSRFREDETVFTFNWSHPRVSVVACRARLYLDLGSHKALVRDVREGTVRVYDHERARGWDYSDDNDDRRWQVATAVASSSDVPLDYAGHILLEVVSLRREADRSRLYGWGHAVPATTVLDEWMPHRQETDVWDQVRRIAEAERARSQS